MNHIFFLTPCQSDAGMPPGGLKYLENASLLLPIQTRPEQKTQGHDLGEIWDQFRNLLISLPDESA